MEAQANRAGKIPAIGLRVLLIVIGILGAALLWISTQQNTSTPVPAAPPVRSLPPEPGSLAYLEFGPTSDTLWFARPDHPENRRKGFSARHVNGYGLVASLSPDSRSIAYTALEPETQNAAPDSPASLYVSAITGGPRFVSKDVDLLVRPVWTPDGKNVVVRRTDVSEGSAAYRLVAVVVVNGQERPLVSSSAALFPVGFAEDGSFFFVEVASGSSDLRILDRGEVRPVAHLADDLTRDWTLSPAGDRLAYLAFSLSTDRFSSRVMVLDLASGEIQPAIDDESDQFAPSWSTSGELALGALVAEQDSAGVATVGGEVNLPAPAVGFDVPAGWSPDGKLLAIRSFSGHSATEPGQSSLAVVGADGFRNVISGQEVTFLGWLTP